MNLVYTRYNAHGHRVTHMAFNSLPDFEAVIRMLCAMGVTLTLTPPGQHDQRIERSVGSLAGRRRAVLASLLYILPLKLEVFC